MRTLLAVLSMSLVLPVSAAAETCVTQSQMQPAEREALVRAGMTFATLTAAGNTEGVRAQTMPQFAQDFGGIQDAIRGAAPHLKGATFTPASVWILDASTAKAGPDGTPQDAQFFCRLNGGAAETSFLIPALPAGRYALVVLDATGVPESWQVAMLLRQGAPGTWQMGGLFPRATATDGHDGLWYWRTAREYAAKKQAWNAWVYYTEAEQLLRPVTFVSSSHLELLEGERSRSAPAALSAGIGTSQPLVIAAKGAEVRVTSLGAEKSPNPAGGIDLLAHVTADQVLPDPAASRARNAAAARAILAAYPELRAAFKGVWIVAELPGGGTYISEEPMSTL